MQVDGSDRTTCCVVGGGPAGAVLSLLLARSGIRVALLEAHKDFNREFRGDTIHPSVLEVLDQIGLAEKLHQLRHSKIYGPVIQTADGPFQPFDFRQLRTRFPYIMVMPQAKFLEFITEEAAKYPEFRLLMGANVQHLVEENGRVSGVEYLSGNDSKKIRALLTVGADGRFSRVRQLAALAPVKASPPIDVLWFRLPRLAGELEATTGLLGRFSSGYVLAVLDRGDYWQIGFVFRKGQYQKLREAGIEAFRRTVARIEPGFERHLEHITDWHELSLLSVESSRCPRWYKPGLLLIGDAAHVMSPVGGVGINYAIQDAVAAANVLREPLLAGSVDLRHLAEIQRRREFPTRVIQRVQAFIQERLFLNVLRSDKTIRVSPLVRVLLKVPGLRDVPARLLAFGINRPRVEHV
jgi:2-polyprenyl-6-methoxyphenol hydroxylase-like FAD-dependent oxidoreductase